MSKTFLSAALAAVLVAGGLAVPVASHAEDASAPAPDAAISLSGGAVAAGVGFVWGSGQLDYQGEPHAVKVSGLSVVDVGVAKISASGSVYNLKTLKDFDGVYTAFAAGATIAGGGGVAYLRNQNGVVIKLNSTSAGLRFNLSANGVTLKVES
ncbi:MAG: hypothetical protein E7812_09590 [Phenylobacterium sp.]|nr:MAG: hypothetical protein E7812_09590 [Phenylobacterium sp.]